MPDVTAALATLTAAGWVVGLPNQYGGGPNPVDVSGARQWALSDLNDRSEASWRHPAADTNARTWTIPANSAVPFPVGTKLRGWNEQGAGFRSATRRSRQRPMT